MEWYNMKKIVWKLTHYKDKEMRDTISYWNKENYSSIIIFFDNITENESGYYIFNNGKISATISKTGNEIVSEDEGKLLTFPKAKG
jgi:hypothetical protein